MAILMLVLCFWNPRGLANKETEFKGFMAEQGAAYGGISESQTYKESSALTDGRYRWDAGTEGKPSERGNGPSRGMGAIIDTSLVEASLVRTGTYTVWHRLETNGNNGTIIVGTGYFPGAKDVRGHRRTKNDAHGQNPEHAR